MTTKKTSAIHLHVLSISYVIVVNLGVAKWHFIVYKLQGVHIVVRNKNTLESPNNYEDAYRQHVSRIIVLISHPLLKYFQYFTFIGNQHSPQLDYVFSMFQLQ